MFCEKCGKELFDESLICPNCGTNTRNFNAKEVKLNTPSTTNTFPKIDNKEAYNIVKKTESKIRKYGYLSFLELTPLLGIMLDMADDYFPFLFIIPVLVLIVIFALYFNLLSNINRLNIENKALQSDIDKIKTYCIATPFINLFMLVLFAFILFNISR